MIKDDEEEKNTLAFATFRVYMNLFFSSSNIFFLFYGLKFIFFSVIFYWPIFQSNF